LDEISIANIAAIADAERQMKEELLRDRTKANEIVQAFQSRFCKENGLVSPSQNSGNRTAVEIVNSLITDVRVVIAQLNRHIKAENIEELKKDNERLSLECDSLREQLKNATKSQQTLPDEDNYVARLFDSLSSQNSKSEPSTKDLPRPTNKRVEVIQEVKEPVSENNNNPINFQILRIAGSSKAVKVNTLIELCKSKLDVPETMIRTEIQKLDDEAMIVIEKAETKPTAKGVIYPDIFRLTKSGMKLVDVEKESELERWINQNKGITYQEVPLIFYAVEEFLPKHGYSLVNLFEEVPFTFKSGRKGFTPHIHLKNDKGANIYLMFEGSGTRGESIHEYFDDYYEFTNGDMYFLCPNGKIARSVEGAVNYHKKNSAKITNIADWAAYDQKLVAGNQVPSTIWFVQLRENLNGSGRSTN